MRLVFFGNYPISLAVLRKLWHHPDVELALVVTKPYFERDGQRHPTPVAAFMEEENQHNVLMYSNDCRQGNLIERIRHLQPDVLVCASYSRLIPSEILKVPRYGAYNFHPSLLPRWRGPDPVRRAIFHGDPFTGVSVHQMTSKFDEGGILFQKRIPIAPQDTLKELLEKIVITSEHLALRLIDAAKYNNMQTIMQIESKATYAAYLKNNVIIPDYRTQPEAFHRLFRAFYPFDFLTISVDGSKYIVNECVLSQTEPKGKDILCFKSPSGYLCFIKLTPK
jgi:methionyl-tRNA formyltransferase